MQPWLIDLSHTAHSRARTGVQRVARSLLAALGPAGAPVTYDPYARRWRPLRAWEQANLAAEGGDAGRRGARWPWAQRWRGRLERWGAGSPGGAGDASAAAGLIVPEIFSARVGAALPALAATVRGPRIAIFHDAIALQFPELSPAGTVARFPGYLQELAGFDGIAAVSADSGASLLDYWRWLGLADPPPVIALPLGIEPPAAGPGDSAGPAPAGPPVVLSVGTLKGRKNHLALLDAAEALWARGMSFELRLIGLAQATTGRAALARITQLQQAGRPLRYDGPVGEQRLQAAYRECAFTVYPSLKEGFGLPVLESLAYGKPCVCAGTGALGEAAAGGGCLTVGQPDAAALAEAVGALLLAPARLDALAAAARARPRRSSREHASELTAWMGGLRRREVFARGRLSVCQGS